MLLHMTRFSFPGCIIFHYLIPHIPYVSVHDGHLGCFHLLAIVKSAAMDVWVQISLQDPHFNFLNKYPEIGLLHHMVVLVLICGGSSMMFSIEYTILHFYTQCTRVPISLCFQQHLLPLCVLWGNGYLGLRPIFENWVICLFAAEL